MLMLQGSKPRLKRDSAILRHKVSLERAELIVNKFKVAVFGSSHLYEEVAALHGFLQVNIIVC